MADKFLVMRHVNKHFGGVHALKDVDFELEQGEIHCLVGQNGCGKSTLIKIIAGVLESDEGSEIEILGKRMEHAGAQRSMDSGVCVIYQDLSLFPNLTVAENIAFFQNTCSKKLPVDWKKIRETSQKALDLIQVDMDLDQTVSALSIADRQLVAIARALAANARLLIMDEPTSSLTRKEVNNLFSVVKDLQSKGMTVLFVSHKLDEIIEIAQRITVIRDGVKVDTCRNTEIDDAKLAYMISGKEITYEQRFAPPGEETVLRVTGLTHPSDFRDVSFTLKKGEILGIIGLLGAGRTELALSLFGMNPPASGSIQVDGKEVRPASNRDAIASGIAYVPEDRLLQGLVIDQNVESNTSVTVIDRLCNKLSMINVKKRRSMTESWIERLSIKSAEPLVNASAMSGGNQQKIVIAKWLAINPKILILDQPTNGIDVSAKDAIYAIIRDLAREGMSIIMISDEIAEIYYNCPRALIMHKGRIVNEVLTDQISEDAFYEEVLHAQ